MGRLAKETRWGKTGTKRLTNKGREGKGERGRRREGLSWGLFLTNNLNLSGLPVTCTAMHRIVLRFVTLCCTTLCDNALHHITMHLTMQKYTPLCSNAIHQYTMQQCTAPFINALYYTITPHKILASYYGPSVEQILAPKIQ